ncbi:MAG: mechanosensitive ion channel [Saprospiraceae bacterium]|nr:mechanosensitive ion channel [Saprospiraceae bacterium]
MQQILDQVIFRAGENTVTVQNLLLAIVILSAARILSYLLSKTLKGRFQRRGVDIGRQFAIITAIKYVLYTISVLWSIQALGFKLSYVWTGAAALLVGVGLGLQQTFMDWISGIVILMEGTVSVGDIVVVDGTVARVRYIGIRTSKVETRDSVVIIIPNSKLVVNNVVNFSNNNEPSRFQIPVGVSYKSDVQLVTKILLQAAEEQKEVLDMPPPSVHFTDFGNSALEFVLHIYCREFFRIERIKSEIRYRIVELFRQHGVEIPFPQRDLWLRNPESVVKVSRSARYKQDDE